MIHRHRRRRRRKPKKRMKPNRRDPRKRRRIAERLGSSVQVEGRAGDVARAGRLCIQIVQTFVVLRV
jgi:hypothetical protein